MKRMPRLLAIILALLMTFAMLAGCAGDVGEDASTTTPAATSPGVTNSGSAPTEQPPQEEAFFPLDETVIITYWQVWPGTVSAYLDTPNDGLYYQTLEELTNVHVEWTLVDGVAVKDQFGIMSAADDFTDIVFSGQSNYSGGGDAAIEQEAFIRINELIEEFAPDYVAALDKYDVWKDVTTGNGNILSFYALKVDIEGSDVGLAVRKDWLDELKMDVPTTYDEVNAALYAFQSELGVTHPMPMHHLGVYLTNSLVMGYDTLAATAPGRGMYPFYQIDGVVEYGLTSDGYREYVSMLAQWYADGILDPDFTSPAPTSNTPDESVINGDVGIFQIGSSQFADLAGLSPDANAEIVALPMTLKNNNQMLHMYKPDIVATDYNVTISQNAADAGKAELICRWLNYNYTEEGATLANYGVEGVTFEYVDGKPQLNDLVLKNSNGYTANTASAIYTNQGAACLTYTLKLYVNSPQSELEAASLWTNGSDGSHMFPTFASMTPQESEDFSTIYNDINTYVAEARLQFITGARSMDEWDAYVAEVEGMGIASAIAIKQASYNRYISN